MQHVWKKMLDYIESSGCSEWNTKEQQCLQVLEIVYAALKFYVPNMLYWHQVYIIYIKGSAKLIEMDDLHLQWC